MNAEDIFRCSIGCEIMLMINARIRLIFSRYSASSNYDIDMTSINTRMFGIMFEVSLLFVSFNIFTFMTKPLFIHTSEKL